MIMNIQNLKRVQQNILFILLLVTVAFIMSCDENIVVGEIDESPYELANKVQSYIKDASTSWRTVRVELRTSTELEVLLGVTSAMRTGANAQVGVGESYVSLYNAENFSSYPPFPAANVSIANSGSLSIAAWQKESEKLSITLQRGDLEDGTYLLPVVIKENNVEVAVENTVVYYFVVVSSAPDNSKICIQNGKPLAHLAYTGKECLNLLNFVLEDSRKLLFDYAVLFAVNPIGPDLETGAMEISFDLETAPVFKNPEKYIRPLQENGIKVLVGILGGFGVNIGLANMQGDQMKDFAAKVKILVDTYGLDGVDLDDEYVSYPSATIAPELYPEWAPSAIKMGRLIVELRRIMPDKIISLYEYGSYLGSALNANNPVDGHIIRDIADMTRNPYYNGNNVRNSSTMGFPNDRFSPVAFWIDQGSNGWTQAQMNAYFTSSRWIDGGYSHLYHYNVNADPRLVEYFSRYTPTVYGEKVVLKSPLIPYTD